MSTTDEAASTASSGQTRCARRDRAWLLLFLVVLGLRLSFASQIPSTFLDFAVDDALYAKQAEALAEGRWLGAYDHATLMKAIGYPVWLAALEVLGIPARMGQELLAWTAAFVLVAALRRLGVGRGWAFFVFLVAVFHPAFTCSVYSRIVRETIYPAQTLLLFAIGLFGLVPLERAQRWLQILAFAAVFAWAWHTREEGVWLLGPAALLVALGVLVAQGRRERWHAALRFGALALLAIVTTAGTHLAIRSLNARFYGESVVLEAKDGSFARAMGALIRAEKDRLPRHPISDATIQSLAEVSPALAEIEGHLLSPSMREDWRTGANGGRIANSMSWAVREGAAAKGHHRSLHAANEFYARMADEIDTYLDRSPDAYGPRRSSLLPPVELARWPEVLGEAWRFLREYAVLDFPRSRPVPELPHRAPNIVVVERQRRVVREPSEYRLQWLAPRHTLLETMHRWYAAVLPWLFSFGLLGLVLQCFPIRARGQRLVTVAALILLSLGICRAALLGAVFVYFAPLEADYLVAGYIPASLGSLLGCYLLVRILSQQIEARWGWARRKRPRAPFWLAPLLLFLALGGTAALAWKNAKDAPQRMLPGPLAAPTSPDLELLVRSHGLRPVHGPEGLRLHPLAAHQEIVINPRTRPATFDHADLRIAGRFLGVRSPQGFLLVVNGQGRTWAGRYETPCEADDEGRFRLLVDLDAERIDQIYLYFVGAGEEGICIQELRLAPRLR